MMARWVVSILMAATVVQANNVFYVVILEPCHHVHQPYPLHRQLHYDPESIVIHDPYYPEPKYLGAYYPPKPHHMHQDWFHQTPYGWWSQYHHHLTDQRLKLQKSHLSYDGVPFLIPNNLTNMLVPSTTTK